MSDLFKILERQLHAASVRHGVIASNIANVDTPGYKARDVKFDEALETATIELRKTSSTHLGAADGVDGGKVAVESRSPWGDGNNVELDVEVSKMTENAVFYQTAVTLLSTNIRMFKSALRR